LSRRVKNLHVVDQIICDNLGKYIEQPTLSVIYDYVPETGFSSRLREKWAEELNRSSWCDWDPTIALLLVILTFLETIEFNWSSESTSQFHNPDGPQPRSDFSYINKVFSVVSSHRSILPLLHTVSLSSRRLPNRTRNVKIRHFRLFHMAPSVKHIRGYKIEGQVQSVDLNKHTTSISFANSLLESEDLRNFLSAFHNLKNLEYFSGNMELTNNVFRDGLVNSKSTLESLIITASDGYMPPCNEEGGSVLGSFGEFSALRVLDVDFYSLIGSKPPIGHHYSNEQLEIFKNCIPINLESLTLRSCDYYTESAMEAVFLRDRVLSKLKTVKVKLSTPAHDIYITDKVLVAVL
jgi:hypothetical protein